MKGGGTKCQTLGWWQMNEAVLRPEKKIKGKNFFRGQKILEVSCIPDMKMIAQLN